MVQIQYGYMRPCMHIGYCYKEAKKFYSIFITIRIPYFMKYLLLPIFGE